jgi:hypothetical protein
MSNIYEGKPPLLKDDIFWKSVNELWQGIAVIALIILEISYEQSKDHSWTIYYFPILFISGISLSLVQNATTKSGSLLKTLVRRLLPLVSLLILPLAFYIFSADTFTLFFILSVYLIVWSIFTIFFQKKACKKSAVMNYLFGTEESPIKEPFGKKTIILRGIVIALLIGYIGWYIIVRIII